MCTILHTGAGCRDMSWPTVHLAKASVACWPPSRRLQVAFQPTVGDTVRWGATRQPIRCLLGLNMACGCLSNQANTAGRREVAPGWAVSKDSE